MNKNSSVIKPMKVPSNLKHLRFFSTIFFLLQDEVDQMHSNVNMHNCKRVEIKLRLRTDESHTTELCYKICTACMRVFLCMCAVDRIFQLNVLSHLEYNVLD